MTPEQDFHARAVGLVSKSCDSSTSNKINPADLEIASKMSVLNPHCEAYIVHGMVEDGKEVMLIKSFNDESQVMYVEVDQLPVNNQEEAQTLWLRYGSPAVEIYTAEERLRTLNDGIGLEA